MLTYIHQLRGNGKPGGFSKTVCDGFKTREFGFPAYRIVSTYGGKSQHATLTIG